MNAGASLILQEATDASPPYPNKEICIIPDSWLYIDSCPICATYFKEENDLMVHLFSHEAFTRDLTLDEVSEILSSTVKEDRTNKLVTFITYLLTYTVEDQINLIFSGKSSSGKSYLPLEIAKYFPQESVIIYAEASATSFFHERGQFDKATGKITIDLRNKILIFLDQPHFILLEKLRPMLSHDQERLIYKITDRNRNASLRTKTVELIGFPTVVFCSSKLSLDEQEKTRCIMLSPEFSQEKLNLSLQLQARKLADKPNFMKALKENKQRNFLRLRIKALCECKIPRVTTKDADRILERFKRDRRYLLARHQRDFPRLISLIKGIALLNFSNREKDSITHSIYANSEDVERGIELYESIAQSNELGIQPEALEIYERIILPCYLKDEGISRREIAQRYWEEYHEHISDRKLREELLPSLESAGLIYQEPDPLDKRKILTYPIYAPKQRTIEQSELKEGKGSELEKELVKA